MNKALKWIGGATGAVIALVAVTAFAGQSLEAQDSGTSTLAHAGRRARCP